MRRFLTPGWLALHALAIVLVIAFLRLGWWQWERATSTGSAQSYGYALQWPAFALFVIFMWVKMVREDLTAQDTSEGAEASAEHSTTSWARPVDADHGADDGEEDEELAAYNRYLARLNAHANHHR